ncbi:MAG: 3-keto-5-aminohexanoate cleavage protein, partial [Devosiaceae bacterium]|nr:3-keto-5-aminohexanoate cleavage protein [Devosiaceae bacterium MH13]
FEAGAGIVHAHVRNDDQTPSSDPDKFARLKEGLEKHCPGMIIQFSTGGRSGAGTERGGHAAAEAGYGLAVGGFEQLPQQQGLPEQPGTGGVAGGPDAHAWHQAGDRSL